MKEPQNKKEVERFLGMITYLAKFVPKVSDISAALRELTKKDTVLHYQVTLSVDASQTGLGAVLLQDGSPVGYASRALTNTEQGYAQIEKELLAIVFGCERFNQFVYGKEIYVESDHKPLEVITKKPLCKTPP